MKNTIKCKNCGEEIEVSDALRHQLEEAIRLEEGLFFFVFASFKIDNMNRIVHI